MPRRGWIGAALAVAAALALGWLLGRGWRPGLPGRRPPPASPAAASARAVSAAALAPAPAPARARLAVVLDDWGYLREPVERLKDLHFPLTTSILPGLPYSRAAAEASHGLGDCVILHCPMQSVKAVRRERETLMAGMDPVRARAMLEAEWNSVPWLSGLNNHEGSKASADRALMDVVAAFLKSRGAFFLDSVTTPHSAIPAAARAAGIRWARRRVFLDDSQDPAAIERQLERAAELSLKDGSCIAIGHPHKATLDVLERVAPGLAARGVTLVTVDVLTHP